MVARRADEARPAGAGGLIDSERTTVILTLSGPPVALAFDPVRPFIYVGVGGSEAVKPSVMVFDRVTLELLGHMSAEAADLSCEAGCAEAEIAVSAEPAVYLAGFLNSPLRSFRFAIPSE